MFDDEDLEVGPEVTVSVTICGKSARITAPANLLDFNAAASRLMASVAPNLPSSEEGAERVYKLVEVAKE